MDTPILSNKISNEILESYNINDHLKILLTEGVINAYECMYESVRKGSVRHFHSVIRALIGYPNDSCFEIAYLYGHLNIIKYLYENHKLYFTYGNVLRGLKCKFIEIIVFILGNIEWDMVEGIFHDDPAILYHCINMAKNSGDTTHIFFCEKLLEIVKKNHNQTENENCKRKRDNEK
jgi:hypothetical protein